MPPRWKLKNVAAVSAIAIAVYLFALPTYYEHSAKVVIPRTKPMDVWEYVADFGNMLRLNPSVLDFAVLSESGDYRHWKYSVRYTENLSHWPHLENVATATFEVRSDWRTGLYTIDSNHSTCFLAGLYCLAADSRFRFSTADNDTVPTPVQPTTLCEELVRYSCPPFAASFCERELRYQRETVMKNLHAHFTA